MNRIIVGVKEIKQKIQWFLYIICNLFFKFVKFYVVYFISWVEFDSVTRKEYFIDVNRFSFHD